MPLLRLTFSLALLLLLAPVAAAHHEGASATADAATYGCFSPALGETERRESQAEALAQGRLPYPLPNGLLFHPTTDAIGYDALATAVALLDAGPGAICLLDHRPDPLPEDFPPDLVGLVWDGYVCPRIGC